MQADEYICALTSAKKTLRKKKVQEEKVGEVYYCKQSIFNARLSENGTVTLHRLSWSRKENEPAPRILFNYSRVDNHYIPTWAEEADIDLSGSAVMSLCSNKT